MFELTRPGGAPSRGSNHSRVPRLNPARPALLDDDRHLSETHATRNPLDLRHHSGDHFAVHDRDRSTNVFPCQRAQTIYSNLLGHERMDTVRIYAKQAEVDPSTSSGKVLERQQKGASPVDRWKL